MKLEQIINNGIKNNDTDFSHITDERGLHYPPVFYLYSKYFPDKGIPTFVDINLNMGTSYNISNELGKLGYKEIYNQYNSLTCGDIIKNNSIFINKDGVMIILYNSTIMKEKNDVITNNFIEKLTKMNGIQDIGEYYAYCSSVNIFLPSPRIINTEEIISQLNTLFREYDLKADDDTTSISMITKDQYGLRFKDFDITKNIPKMTNMDLYYGEGFTDYNNQLIDRLTNEKSGLVLFHGEPGTGKTYYIRHLLNNLVKENKRILYIPPSMVEMISEPSMIDFLSSSIMDDSRDTIILIEDAEPLLEKRNGVGRTNGITNLLNSTDGLLNDILGLTVICTFNTNLDNIDSALLRPGRLISRKEFNKLSYEDTMVLCDELNIAKDRFDPKETYTISEIMCEKEGDNILYHGEIKKEVKLGFK